MPEKDYFKPPLPELRGVLERVCWPIRDVNVEYRLLSEQRGLGLTEFYSEKLESQIIMFDEGGAIEDRHYHLAQSGLSVFSPVMVEGNILLIVPEGAKTISKIAHLFGRNIEYHSDLYEAVGQKLKRIHNSGLGLPDGRILERFALAANASDQHGASLYVLPPYDFNAQVDEHKMFSVLEEELFKDIGLTEAQTEYFIDRVLHGWQSST